MDVMPLISQDLRRNFVKFTADNSEKNIQTELEVRFGSFYEGRFDSKLVDVSLYRNLLKHLDSACKRHPGFISKTKVTKIIDYDCCGVRRINENSETLFYQRKVKVCHYDNLDWGIRFAKSSEINLNDKDITGFTPVHRRYCYRKIYVDTRHESYFCGFQIELSKVVVNNKKHYELELEILPGAVLELDRLWGAIKTLYGWMLNAMDVGQIISIKERFYVSRTLNELLTGIQSQYIVPSILTRPKTLTKLEDVRNRAISIKIDGEHKIVIFCKHGVYACSPSMNIVKIGDNHEDSYTVIECEYLSSKNRFIAFDILIYENKDIRPMTFRCRHNCLKNLISGVKLKYGSIEIKKFYFPKEAQNIIHDYCNTSLPTDGLILQPLGPYDNTIYKWKPSEKLTIDFYLYTEDRDNWCAYVLKSGNFIKMHCTVKGGIIPPQKLNGRVVECRWIPEGKYWEPVRIRHDKIMPNSFIVAMDNIKMLKNPITFERLIGEIVSSDI